MKMRKLHGFAGVFSIPWPYYEYELLLNVIVSIDSSVPNCITMVWRTAV